MKKLLFLGGLLLLFVGCAPGATVEQSSVSLPQSTGATDQRDTTIPFQADIKGGKLLLGEGVVLGEEEQALLLDFMDRYYQSLSTGELQDPTPLFAPGAVDQALGNRTIWEYLLAVRGMQKSDLTLTGYWYTLICQEAEVLPDGRVELFLTERSRQYFPGWETPAESEILYHRFTLLPTADGWRIESHLQMDSLYLVLFGSDTQISGESYQRTRFEQANPEAFFAGRLEALLQEAREQVANRSTQGNQEVKAAANPYDRGASVEYALAYAGERSEDWPDYGAYGGNCQNYTSQCLLAGGIPMDTTSPAVWKWYGESPSTGGGANGRSPSWSGVEAFLQYARENEGAGLVARVDAPFYSGKPGDIIHLGHGGEWSHTVLITEVLTDEDGNTVDYLVSSNTADLRNYPVSAYFYTQQMLIAIDGWN